MDTTHEETYRGYTIKVYPDENPMDPRRDWEHLGTMVCWHGNYVLGDGGNHHGKGYEYYETPRAWLETLASQHVPFEVENLTYETLLEIIEKHYLVLPISLLDHSGLHMYLGHGAHACDCGGWDSGPVGYIYVSHADICKEYGVKRVGCRSLARARACLESEVKIYDYYLTGAVYWYVIESKEGESIGSCGGFFGYGKDEGSSWEYMLQEARSEVDAYIQKLLNEHVKQLKAWLLHHVPLESRTALSVC